MGIEWQQPPLFQNCSVDYTGTTDTHTDPEPNHSLRLCDRLAAFAPSPSAEPFRRLFVKPVVSASSCSVWKNARDDANCDVSCGRRARFGQCQIQRKIAKCGANAHGGESSDDLSVVVFLVSFWSS